MKDTIYNYQNKDNSNRNSLGGEIALNYKKEFEEKGHNIYYDMSFSNRNSNTNTFNNYYYHYNPLYDSTENYNRLYNNKPKSQSGSIRMKLDYEKTIQYLGNLGTGASYSNSNNGKYDYNCLFNNEQLFYEFNPNISDNYDYYNNLFSAYLTLGKK